MAKVLKLHAVAADYTTAIAAITTVVNAADASADKTAAIAGLATLAAATTIAEGGVVATLNANKHRSKMTFSGALAAFGIDFIWGNTKTTKTITA